VRLSDFIIAIRDAFLNSLGDYTRRHYDVRLLKGALYSGLDQHELALDELEAAIRVVRTLKSLSDIEKNYLVAYAVQYGEWSASQIGRTHVTREVAELLHVEDPIEAGRVSKHMRTKFPLNVEFVGVRVAN
jgi:hypothetical protein